MVLMLLTACTVRTRAVHGRSTGARSHTGTGISIRVSLYIQNVIISSTQIRRSGNMFSARGVILSCGRMGTSETRYRNFVSLVTSKRTTLFIFQNLLDLLLGYSHPFSTSLHCLVSCLSYSRFSASERSDVALSILPKTGMVLSPSEA
jgi:hypothetical protein